MFYDGHSSPGNLWKRGAAERDARQGDLEDRAPRRMPTILLLAVCAALLVLALPGCGVSASTPKISDAKMASDKGGEHPTKVFSPNDTFYCIATLNNVPENTPIKAVWTAADVKGVKPDTEIKQEQASTKITSGRLQFILSSNSPWPTGKYEVDLYLDDAKKPAETLEFEVR